MASKKVKDSKGQMAPQGKEPVRQHYAMAVQGLKGLKGTKGKKK
jgi:hypothetical protein